MGSWGRRLAAAGLAAVVAAVMVIAVMLIPHGAEPYPSIVEEIYGGTRLLVARPHAEGRAPTLILVHREGADSEAAVEMVVSYSEKFLPMGAVLIAVDYHKSVMGGVELKDVLNAVEYAKTKGYVDPTRICVIGEGHGGYLALLAAANSDFKCVVDAYGPTHLQSMMKYARKDPGMWAMWGEGVLQMIEECEEQGINQTQCLAHRSPLSYAGKIEEDVLIMHGDSDEVVPVSQSIFLASSFEHMGKKNFVLKIYKGVKHGFSLLQGKPYHDLVEFLHASIGLEKVG